MAQIDTFYPTQYQTAVDLAVQQMQSKVLANSLVTREDFVGKRKAYNVYNKRAAVLIAARSQATPVNEADLTKVWSVQSAYEWTETFNEFDDFFLSQIVLPTSEAVQTSSAAFSQTIDTVALAAAVGSRLIGEDGTTPDALPSGQKIAINYVEGTTTPVNSGLTIGKLRQAQYILDSKDVPSNDRIIFISSAQKRELLRAGEIGSADYNTVRALVDGEIDTFMGFKFVWTNFLPAVNGGSRPMIAMHKSGLRVSVGQTKTYMDVRPDIRHSLAVRSTLLTGAVRTQNELVVEIACAE